MIPKAYATVSGFMVGVAFHCATLGEQWNAGMAFVLALSLTLVAWSEA